MTMEPEIRPHPAGGHTIAVPVPGTVSSRIYVGNWATPDQAAIALAGARPRIERALQLAGALATALEGSR